ncbi:MAG: helix-turn-helix domain-containing protein [Nitrospira sp.]|nr:helix-turn-helix domain-containing protein [Nitrospira sp.]
MRLLNVKDVAARLQVKDKTIYAWAAQGKIPTLKINGVIRFEEYTIDRWLQDCKVLIEHRSPSPRMHRPLARPHVDRLIENAKRAVYTQRGETRPIASPFGEEERNGTR